MYVAVNMNMVLLEYEHDDAEDNSHQKTSDHLEIFKEKPPHS